MVLSKTVLSNGSHGWAIMKRKHKKHPIPANEYVVLAWACRVFWRGLVTLGLTLIGVLIAGCIFTLWWKFVLTALCRIAEIGLSI